LVVWANPRTAILTRLFYHLSHINARPTLGHSAEGQEMFWRSRVEDKVDCLVDLLCTWRKRDMANWSDLAAKIIELKRETERVFAVLDDVRARLDAVLKADMVDQVEIQKAHDAVAEVVAEMDSKIHADGM
jgi:hypothetical protein